MAKYVHTQHFQSEDITHLTTFFYLNPGETLEIFLKRVQDSISRTPRKYGDKFIAVVDGMIFDMDEFYREIDSYKLNPVETFKKFQSAQKSVNQKYLITQPSNLTYRPLILLNMACSGNIPSHHAEVTDFAKSHSNTHYLVTSSHLGIYDVDVLMQLTKDQIKQYIDDSNQQKHEVTNEDRIMYSFQQQLDKLLEIIEKAPPHLQTLMQANLSCHCNTQIITAILQQALNTITTDRATDAITIETVLSSIPQEYFKGGK